MKRLITIFSVLLLASCGTEAEADAQSSDPAQAAPASDAENSETAISSDELPDFAMFPGECPKDWGIVVGATQDHVVKFIQNYFFVPKGGPSPMYSVYVVRGFRTSGVLI